MGCARYRNTTGSGPRRSSPSTVSLRPRRTTWCGRNASTRRRPSWARRTSWPPASVLPPVTSRAGRAEPSPCSEGSGSPSRLGDQPGRTELGGARPPLLRDVRSHMSKPTIVLVHGAFGDASSWRPVFDQFTDDEYTVLAAAVPLLGVARDASYLGAVIDQLDKPVVLVGHSYSGCAITVAGASDNVAGLVYVAGFVPDRGETIADLQSRFPSLAMGNFLQPRPLPDGGVELSVDPQRFQDIFCADVPEAEAAFMARAQRPLVGMAFEEPAAAAAWRARRSEERRVG